MPQTLDQKDSPASFVSANWMAYPAVGSPQPWLIDVVGIALVNFQGGAPKTWNRDYVDLLLDLTQPYKAITASLPPPPAGEVWAFPLKQWDSFATINSIAALGEAPNFSAGFAVDAFQVIVGAEAQVAPLPPVSPIFTSLRVNLAVCASEAYLYRVGYKVSMLTVPQQITPYVIP